MAAEVADYEFERLGYERRLAGAKVAGDKDLAADLAAQIQAVDAVISDMKPKKGASARKATAEEEAGLKATERAEPKVRETAVGPSAEKKG